MAAPAAILAVKAAIAVATDKRGRTVIASVVAAVLLPFILVIVMLLSIIPILRRFRFQIPERSMPTSNSGWDWK